MAKYIIVGGVAGGASAAARLRRLDEKAEIILLERGEYISYANCGLPYYVGDVIEDRSKLFVMTPERFRATLNVDVRIKHEATAIDAPAKKITIVDRASGQTYTENYDALVLSPGAEPVKPPIPGIDSKNIFTLRSVPDTDTIKKFVDTQKPERAIIIGAGFIGLEMAENLHHRGVFVTIVEALDQVMNVIDSEMAAIVHQHIKSKNVEMYLSDSVTAFEEKQGKTVVKLQSGEALPADMVILSIGVKPDTRLAKDAGLALDARGAIIVNKYLCTSDPFIYAVGDAVAIQNPLTGKQGAVPLAGPANKQARIAANAIVNGAKGESYNGAIGTSVAKVFDMTVACTGLSEKVCVRENIAHNAVIVHPANHAGYYPGAKPLSLKVVFDPVSGKILGGQCVGYEGVDKRIDVLAAFISMGADTSALAEFEHTYAPPYASAKDPVNYAGFVAENMRAGITSQVRWNDVARLKSEGAFILDVRTPEEFALGHIDGSTNISNTDIRARLNEIPRDTLVLIYCGVGIRGYLAERILRQHGWTKLVNLAGGWKTYETAIAEQSNRNIFRPGHKTMHQNMAESIAYSENTGMPETLKALSTQIHTIDACGLQCPGPILKLKTAIDSMQDGATLVVSATDPGFSRDAQSWCNLTGNTLLDIAETNGVFQVRIQKNPAHSCPDTASNSCDPKSKEATIIVFSDDFDKALASFVIANGAAASGKKVTMFFTFWGLSVIKRKEKVAAEKDFMGRMFGMMLPKNSEKLALSKMNFAGFGPLMMKGRMNAKKIDQLEQMMANARAAGVTMTACQMSMDIMGIAKEELIDGVEIGGVATYLYAAESSGLNLFI